MVRPARVRRVRRVPRDENAATTSPVVARAAALLGDDLSVLSAAVEAAELVDALTTGEPKTVFAPSDAAFAKACEELQLSKEEILQVRSI